VGLCMVVCNGPCKTCGSDRQSPQACRTGPWRNRTSIPHELVRPLCQWPSQAGSKGSPFTELAVSTKLGWLGPPSSLPHWAPAWPSGALAGPPTSAEGTPCTVIAVHRKFCIAFCGDRGNGKGCYISTALSGGDSQGPQLVWSNCQVEGSAACSRQVVNKKCLTSA
jgi:hypothetical protein